MIYTISVWGSEESTIIEVELSAEQQVLVLSIINKINVASEWDALAPSMSIEVKKNGTNK